MRTLPRSPTSICFCLFHSSHSNWVTGHFTVILIYVLSHAEDEAPRPTYAPWSLLLSHATIPAWAYTLLMATEIFPDAIDCLFSSFEKGRLGSFSPCVNPLLKGYIMGFFSYPHCLLLCCFLCCVEHFLLCRGGLDKRGPYRLTHLNA